MPTIATTSSGEIHRLDPGLINQIAAGEVIVRPSSAVKELVENSLDAGASDIEVSIEPDTRSFSVRDDGRGMSPEDARLSVERYATSKIREFDDLQSLVTRGFRGEALAAIASVSRFDLLTRRADDEGGVRLRTEGGQNIRVQTAGAPPGTTVTVRDLFFNTPARMKFLRTPVSEWGHILKALTRQALTRPDIGFRIRWRGRPYLTLSSGQSLGERLSALLPRDQGRDLIDIETTLHGVRVTGCISHPTRTRRDRRHQYYFANGRPIVSRPLTFALQEAYKGLVMTQQFPLAAVFIELAGGEIDVNVHPTKEEVRFHNESLIAGAIHRAALEALRGADLIPSLDISGAFRTPGAKFGARPRQFDPPRGPAAGTQTGQIVESGTDLAAGSDGPRATPGFFHPDQSSPASLFVAGSGSEGKASIETVQSEIQWAETDGRNEGGRASDALSRGVPAPESARSDGDAGGVYPDQTAGEEAGLIRSLHTGPTAPRVLGQIELTYILAAAPGLGLLLIDQHAAHEKIMYREFMSAPKTRDVQALMVPYMFEASASEAALLESLCGELSREGFDTEPFGGGTFVITSLPALFEGLDVAAFIRDLLDDLGGGDLRREIAGLRHRIGARAACRAAIKAGDSMTIPEMQRLVEQVLETADALRCPHGRPTMILLSKDQLDRRFGRI